MAANEVIGAGFSFSRSLGVDGEFMRQGLPFQKSAIDAIGASQGASRVYSLTANAIVHIPLRSRLGIYAIGDGGWYHRSGDLTIRAVVSGTGCSSFWLWLGACATGLTTNQTIVSRSIEAFGGNIGGELTFRSEGRMKLYAEVRYHHAAHNSVETDVLPLTFGLRW